MMMWMPGPIEIMIVLITPLVIVVPFWKIFSKAGFPAWLSILMLVPLANLLLLFFLAFAEWPVHREVNLLKGPSNA